MTEIIMRFKIPLIVLGTIVCIIFLWWAIAALMYRNAGIKNGLKFNNVTIGAKDVTALSGFYQTVFGFTALENNGSVLAAPGYGANEMTFRFVPAINLADGTPVQANDLGYAHLCFEADDVYGVFQKLMANGGSIVSTFEKQDREVAVYARDPEGNIAEIHVPTPEKYAPADIFRLLGSAIRAKLGIKGKVNAKIRFLHVNIITGDWKRSSAFYQSAFGAKPFGKQRDYEDDWIQNLVGVRDIHVIGEHVKMPGYGAIGPTLEIFTYNKESRRRPLTEQDQGIISVGFMADNLTELLQAIDNAGGSIVSQAGNNSAIAQDPDGNLITITKK